MPVMNANSAGGQYRYRQRDQRFAQTMRCENANRVGAEPHGCGMAERDERHRSQPARSSAIAATAKIITRVKERENVFFRAEQGAAAERWRARQK